MKTREEQIAEMAKAMADFELEDTAKCDTELSEHLFAKGYRKQSDTVREFVGRIAKLASTMQSLAYNEHQKSNLIKAAQALGEMVAIEYIMTIIKKLAKEYGAEV